jgi:hypothetical protein
MPPYKERKNTHECVFFSLYVYGGGWCETDCGGKKKESPPRRPVFVAVAIQAAIGAHIAPRVSRIGAQDSLTAQKKRAGKYPPVLLVL